MGKLSRKEKAGQKWGGRKAENLASFSSAGPKAPKLPLSDSIQKCQSGESRQSSAGTVWGQPEQVMAS